MYSQALLFRFRYRTVFAYFHVLSRATSLSTGRPILTAFSDAPGKYLEREVFLMILINGKIFLLAETVAGGVLIKNAEDCELLLQRWRFEPVEPTVRLGN